MGTYAEKIIGKSTYIGVSEIWLRLERMNSAGGVESGKKFNMHVLYSLSDGNITAHCLDYSVYTRLDMHDEIKAAQKDGRKTPADIAEYILVNVTRNMIVDTVDYIFISAKDKVDDVAAYAPTEFWNMYRDIRKQRDNMAHKELFEYGDDDANKYEDKEEILKRLVEQFQTGKKILDIVMADMSYRPGVFDKSIEKDLVTC